MLLLLLLLPLVAMASTKGGAVDAAKLAPAPGGWYTTFTK